MARYSPFDLAFVKTITVILVLQLSFGPELVYVDLMLRWASAQDSKCNLSSVQGWTQAPFRALSGHLAVALIHWFNHIVLSNVKHNLTHSKLSHPVRKIVDCMLFYIALASLSRSLMSLVVNVLLWHTALLVDEASLTQFINSRFRILSWVTVSMLGKYSTTWDGQILQGMFLFFNSVACLSANEFVSHGQSIYANGTVVKDSRALQTLRWVQSLSRPCDVHLRLGSSFLIVSSWYNVFARRTGGKSFAVTSLGKAVAILNV